MSWVYLDDPSTTYQSVPVLKFYLLTLPCPFVDMPCWQCNSRFKRSFFLVLFISSCLKLCLCLENCFDVLHPIQSRSYPYLSFYPLLSIWKCILDQNMIFPPVQFISFCLKLCLCFENWPDVFAPPPSLQHGPFQLISHSMARKRYCALQWKYKYKKCQI